MGAQQVSKFLSKCCIYLITCILKCWEVKRKSTWSETKSSILWCNKSKRHIVSLTMSFYSFTKSFAYCNSHFVSISTSFFNSIMIFCEEIKLITFSSCVEHITCLSYFFQKSAWSLRWTSNNRSCCSHSTWNTLWHTYESHSGEIRSNWLNFFHNLTWWCKSSINKKDYLFGSFLFVLLAQCCKN